MLVVACPDLCDAEYLLSKVNYEKVCDNKEIFNCEYLGCEFLLVITGYGKVNIGSSLQNVLNISDIDGLVQIGTAGSLCSDYNIFDIFIVNKSLQFDVDFTKLGYSLATLPVEKSGIFNSNLFLEKCIKKLLSKCDKTYIEGIAATSDSFVASSNFSSCIKNKFNANIVDAECGSVAQFCFNNKIPFIGIKVISNQANNNGACQYKLYNEEASVLSQRITLNFIEEYHNQI